MIEERLKKHTDLLTERYPVLKSVRADIEDAYLIMQECYENDGKLLIAGNGGSAADAEHIVGELMKSFRLSRRIDNEMAEKLETLDPIRGKKLAESLEKGLMAIPLTAHEALTTAYMNDSYEEGVYAQQLYGYARKNDVFLGISTSGNSENILAAAVTAKASGIKVIGLTGRDGGKLAKIADKTVIAPENETYMIQELHLPIYHCWCLMLEDYFFGA